MDRSKLYDQIYDEADRLLKKHNPCNIKCINGNTTCTNSIHNNIKCNALCCNYCMVGRRRGKNSYWSEQGCTIKCLKCKLYLCPSAQMKYRHKKWYHKLEQLKRKADKYELTPYFYETKEQVFSREKEIICQ